MKATKLTKLITIFLGLSISSMSPALAIEPAAKREIYHANKGSVYGLKGVLNVTINTQGKTNKQEGHIWSNATCIKPGLLVVSYASINPNLGNGNPNVIITKEVKNLKLVNAEGEEFDAKLVLHDEDIGIAFIALDPNTKNIANWNHQAVNISKDIPLEHFDETINISRYSSLFQHKSAVTVGTVAAILEKPRKLYQIINSSLSAPSFNHDGEFVGITVTLPSANPKQQKPPVTIPAKYIRKLAAQATLIQNKQSNEPSVESP